MVIYWHVLDNKNQFNKKRKLELCILPPPIMQNTMRNGEHLWLAKLPNTKESGEYYWSNFYESSPPVYLNLLKCLIFPCRPLHLERVLIPFTWTWEKHGPQWNLLRCNSANHCINDISITFNLVSMKGKGIFKSDLLGFLASAELWAKTVLPRLCK